MPTERAKTPRNRNRSEATKNDTHRRWVRVDGAKTTGTQVHEDDYLSLDPRLVELRDAFLAKKIKAAEVREKLAGIVGHHRLWDDWAEAVAGRKAPKGRDQGIWEMETFEAWLAAKPLEYRRIYHDVRIVGAALFRVTDYTA